MSKLFSVVIPTYNQAKFLKKSVSSVLSQSINDYEIIIIDNFSNDETEKIVKEFKSDKIIYRKKNNNGVIGVSRNEGIKLSSGRWIAFLDSDDYWYNDRLKLISEFIYRQNEKDSYDVITNDEKWISNENKKNRIYKYGPFTKNFYKKLLIEGNCISNSATVVKKDFLIKNNLQFSENKDFVTVEDYDFYLCLALKGAKFKFIHKVLGEHLFHKDSASSFIDKHLIALEKMITFHISEKQNFSKNKKKLIKNLKCYIDLKKIVFQIKEKKNYGAAALIFIRNFVYRPIIFLNFLLKQTVNRISNSYFH